MRLRQPLFLITTLILIATPAAANTLSLQTPAPVIHLANNLDEKDNLGWCIDTLGRGFAERLQAHSCKPQGGDVQFVFDAATGLVQSAEYSDYCMANNPNNDTTFALVKCDALAQDQQFIYNESERTISPKANEEVCVSVGESSRSAGPFMSRSLLLTSCAETDSSLKEWVIVE